MAERRTRRAALQVSFDYTFDRLLESNLAQAHDILVPGMERMVGGSARAKQSEHEDESHLRSSVLRAAARGTYRYIRKTDEAPASYQVNDTEAQVVAAGL